MDYTGGLPSPTDCEKINRNCKFSMQFQVSTDKPDAYILEFPAKLSDASYPVFATKAYDCPGTPSKSSSLTCVLYTTPRLMLVF